MTNGKGGKLVAMKTQPKHKTMTRSARAGLQFPVGR
jgi:hypothetical protein